MNDCVKPEKVNHFREVNENARTKIADSSGMIIRVIRVMNAMCGFIMGGFIMYGFISDEAFQDLNCFADLLTKKFLGCGNSLMFKV